MFMWLFDEMKHKITYQEPSAEGGGTQVLHPCLQTAAWVAVMLLGLYSDWSDLSVGMSRSNCPAGRPAIEAAMYWPLFTRSPYFSAYGIHPTWWNGFGQA